MLKIPVVFGSKKDSSSTFKHSYTSPNGRSTENEKLSSLDEDEELVDSSKSNRSIRCGEDINDSKLKRKQKRESEQQSETKNRKSESSV